MSGALVAPEVRSVIVTGCAGFIGSHLAEALLSRGRRVIGIDALTPTYATALKRRNLESVLKHPDFTFEELDLAADDTELQLPSADAICHLAAEPGVRASWDAGFGAYVRNNCLATQRVLAAASAHEGPPRIVYASSSSIYGNAGAQPTTEQAPAHPVSPYGVTKFTGEQLCHAFAAGLPSVTILRFFTVYGPRQRPDMAFSRFIAKALAREPLTVYGDGNQTRDFTYVGDVVDAVATAATDHARPGVTTLNIGGGSPVSLREALSVVDSLVDGRLGLAFEPHARGDARHTSADTSRARSILGYDPSTRLREGLALQVAWVRGTAGLPPAA